MGEWGGAGDGAGVSGRGGGAADGAGVSGERRGSGRCRSEWGKEGQGTVQE